MQPKRPSSSPKTRLSGFRHAGGVLSGRIRGAAESRGFSHAQIVTRWPEIVGPDIARIAEPVKVTYARQGVGATLVVLTKGAFGPELEMQKPRIREAVNAIYGYNAIARVQITQTAGTTGFAEARAPFEAAPNPVTPAKSSAVRATVAPIESENLRDALARLGQNIMSKTSVR